MAGFVDKTDWAKARKSLDFISTTTRGFNLTKQFADQIRKFAKKNGANIEVGLPTKQTLDEWRSKQWQLMTLSQFGGIESIEAFNAEVAMRYWASHDAVNDGIMWRNHYVVYRDKDFDIAARKAEQGQSRARMLERQAQIKGKEVSAAGAPDGTLTMDQEHTSKRVPASRLADAQSD
ncbi:MAG TPA: hypothetical protein VM075_00765 [Anaerolineae bacterium]|nr:hypothetical protein [Anaerolineae bacterium]